MADCTKGFEIFILSGQSNMSGRGGMQTIVAKDGSTSRKWDGIVPAECAAEPGSILRLNKNLEWEEAHEPTHIDIDTSKACGVGPGLVFAASLLRARKYKVKPTGPQIGLVPCAIGGTSIVQWEKGRVLYNHMIQRTKAALEKGGTLKALLWYQGESDAVEKSLADHYEQRLVTFFNHVRTDLNNHNLPIIQVAINWPAAPHPEYVNKVRSAQRAALDHVKHLHLVDALGLPLLSDHIHLTTEAQTELGLMLLEKYISTGEGKD
ncbi:probable carbohydrate esterase At4g34215 [Physcomitrium patens]|nr:probable carbohydrate esterase At4g34215 [Physcomitrium patens]XP_024402313.1 probable carbohydrate esterase At4g34215 [Physcomitrium patens]XP_024402321.1 probable carbohydrate esterase At4g34215 [Physcomitrium patens]XP_024402328.1 probable carbohydrate esterase At4g34215 [Physcomitrium patens]XP_024402337.1 probable carbohydrate esterase At4g34215 [Physcomitrium patens]PNR60499.1 hypothetical protein PHYPA_003292 [Physcomitrium patens]|eukprot:XP_024402306.1 probable carbohydrate esterase At4g34215 [Physcomitrella patens]